MQVKELKEFLNGVSDDALVIFEHRNGKEVVGKISYHIDTVEAKYPATNSKISRVPGVFVLSSQDPVIFRSIKSEIGIPTGDNR